ncbi:hypothetical protein LWI28_000558 [Acer negundo]|uniref:DRBM domain-containing protein n=1 Tax=Acer negundo TaxID=4023 RepID=A0AAD5JKU0_ACENE|nr:hypothetical protein LWI28_000558 [Acer negundo]KAK4857355.1 hypothetical protein QYF36_027136 [Acer negundo]
MLTSDVCPTEDTIHVILEHVVDPMLPAKSSVRDTPSLSDQQLVAKQVHAVVLLYNYYHRKQHQQLKFEGFEPFCKLAVVQKPTLLAHMKLMQRSNDAELDDMEKQLSLTEKSIMDACDISKSLDASKDVPSIEGWPISKIAVLLIDSKKENCFLQFGSITKGVWSVIEKDMNASNCIAEGMEAKHLNKKIKVTKKPLRDEVSNDEVFFQQFAISAVKEATGFNQSDLIIVGSDVVYSLSKEKTAARFYLVQCTQPNIDDVINIPIKDAIDSLQGPLVTRSSGQWAITPVVEYFHLLPYARIVSDLLSREVPSNGLQDKKLALENINISSSSGREKPYKPEVHNNQDRSHVNSGILECLGRGACTSIKPPKLKGRNMCSSNDLSVDHNGHHIVDIDACSVVSPQSEDKCKNITTSFQLDNHHEMINPSLKSDLNGTTGGESKISSSTAAIIQVEMCDIMKMPRVTECRGDSAGNLKATFDAISLDQDDNQVDDHTLDTYQSNAQDLDKLQNTFASKENILSQTALRVLLSKRDKLTLQQRNIEDQIALCDKKIQTILNRGEDDLAVKIESVVDGCNDVCLRSVAQERISQHLENQQLPDPIKMKRLSEAVLNKQNSCQELDGICYENNWILPTYRVSPSDGGFQASVTVKGMDFECSSIVGQCSNPRKARESAASQMLGKLRSMASLSQ